MVPHILNKNTETLKSVYRTNSTTLLVDDDDDDDKNNNTNNNNTCRHSPASKIAPIPTPVLIAV